jgi:hypothetical protein
MGPCSLCTHEMLTRGQGLAQTLSDSAGVVVVPAGHMRRFPGTVRVLSSREGTAALLRHKLAAALIHPRRNAGPTPPVGGLRRVVLYSSTSVGILCMCVGMHFFLTRLNINSSTVDGEKHTNTMTSHLHDRGLYFWTGIYTVPWWKINKRTSPFTDDS